MTENPQKSVSVISSRTGNIAVLVVVFLVVAVLLGWGGYAMFFNSGDKDGPTPMLTKVEFGEFVSQVLDQGEIQSAENFEIRCQVSSRNDKIEVIDVVEEGKIVKEGDFLVQLDATSFEKELEQQQIAVTNAETQVISAKAAYDAAVVTLNEYLEGTYKEQERTIKNEIFDARQEQDQANADLQHNLRLHARGYINNTQLNAFQVAVERAANSLRLAEQKLNVLENITKKKETLVLQGDIDAAKIAYQNEQEMQRLEQEKLQEIKEQIENCRIVVPKGVTGEVVYNKEFDRRGGSDWVLEPGAQVRERQVLIKLPDRTKMEVKALINEQSITLIKPGMPCSIKVDALNNQTLKGVVTYVNRTAESSGWMSSSVREYAAFVRILEPPAALIPGMNASVVIQTQFEANAYTAPIQCIYSSGDEHFVLRKTPDGYETVNVEIGGDNTQVAWIKGGVEEGDMLALNPGAYKELMDLPEVQLEQRIQIPDSASDLITTSRSKKERGGEMASQGKEGGREGGGRPGGGGGFSVDMIVDRSMDRYDTNSDGKIDADEQKEVDSRMRGRLSEADEDGDGAISRDELKTSMEAMMKRFQSQQGGMGGGMGRGGSK